MDALQIAIALTALVIFVACAFLLIVLAAVKFAQRTTRRVTPTTVQASLADGGVRSAFTEFLRQLYPWPPPSTPLAIEATLKRWRERLECLELFESALEADERACAHIQTLKRAIASLLEMVERNGSALDKERWRHLQLDMAKCRYLALREIDHGMKNRGHMSFDGGSVSERQRPARGPSVEECQAPGAEGTHLDAAASLGFNPISSHRWLWVFIFVLGVALCWSSAYGGDTRGLNIGLGGALLGLWSILAERRSSAKWLPLVGGFLLLAALIVFVGEAAEVSAAQAWIRAVGVHLAVLSVFVAECILALLTWLLARLVLGLKRH